MTYPNPEQRQVLRHLHGTLLVLAPAGTGKTRIMADRLAAVIASGTSPEVTLGVTFTNRAAEHMRGAVLESCGPAAKLCRIQTFHSLCAWMLRLESRDLGLPSDFVIYDEQDSIGLMRECLKAPDISPDSLFQQLSQMKSDCAEKELTLATIPALDMRHLAAPVRATILAYHQQLAERNALDFPDLLYRTRAMLALLPEKRAKWSARFRWIQMDEVQDTHLSEYEVIRLLATHATGIAFFGDLDQTIYEWRGSNPAAVMQRVKTDLGPVTELSLQDNYRATKSLLRVADRHAATLTHRSTHTHPAPSLPEGTAPEFNHSYDPLHEANWIAARLQEIQATGDPGKIGILTRTHNRAATISDSLKGHGIPHLTVEQFDFFRRQEIKDLLARLRLLLNPADSGALQRMILRPACGIGPATLQKLFTDGQPCGLRLTDLAQLRSHRDGDPFHSLLHALAHGTVVVFDVETTGLSPAVDEVIDLSRRFLDLERHDLATVCQHFATRNRPSHRALADALATAEILLRLSPQLAAGARDRQNLIARHGKPFLPIAEKLASWRELSHAHRPPDLCQRILDESGLRDLGDDRESLGSTLDRRHANLDRFIEFCQRHDDPARPPVDLLAELTNRAALARNLDFLATDDASIPILTIHQSKGLEFDTVIIAGLAEDEFPSYYAKRDLKLEEEKRLFYVALTRAKRHLILSSYGINDWGHDKPPSSFLTGLI